MTHEKQHTYVLILDDDVVEFLDCQAGMDINSYLNGLLKAEADRQRQAGNGDDLDALIQNAPDATTRR